MVALERDENVSHKYVCVFLCGFAECVQPCDSIVLITSLVKFIFRALPVETDY